MIKLGFVKRIVRKKRRYYYYCEKVNRNGKWVDKIIRQATPEEIAATHISKHSKNDIVLISCSNPDCDKFKKMTRGQKRRINTTYPRRYNEIRLVYCSRECRQSHNKVLGNGD